MTMAAADDPMYQMLEHLLKDKPDGIECKVSSAVGLLAGALRKADVDGMYEMMALMEFGKTQDDTEQTFVKIYLRAMQITGIFVPTGEREKREPSRIVRPGAERPF